MSSIMKRLNEEFYNPASEYLSTPAAIEVDEKTVEGMWMQFRAAFDIPNIESVTTYESPAFAIFDDEDEEISVENDGWRFTETVIYKRGDIWLRWYQKHGGELLEVCVRRGADE